MLGIGKFRDQYYCKDYLLIQAPYNLVIVLQTVVYADFIGNTANTPCNNHVT